MEVTMTPDQRREFDRLSAASPVPVAVDEFMQQAIDAGLKEWADRLRRFEASRANQRRWQRFDESVDIFYATQVEPRI